MNGEIVGAASGVDTVDGLAALLRQLRRRQAHQRRDSELTYREIAARTGWSIGIIAGYFAGRTLPPTDRFDILVALLGATPAEQGSLATLRDRIADGRRGGAGPASGVPGWPKPRQLPADVPHFTGREAELAELDERLPLGGSATSAVISTISGTAGVGKTALAIHWSHRAAARFPDGQIYLNLRGFDGRGPAVGAAEALRGLLEAFGVEAQRIPLTVEAQSALFRSVLADRRVLLVLDNARSAEQIRPMLPGSPHCLTLITSRNRLSSLVVTEGAQPLLLELPSATEGVRILSNRLGPEAVAREPEAVDELVRRCARLPLALAIIAARARAEPSLTRLVTQLRDARQGLDAFADEDATADVRAVFSYSLRALGEPAARMFRLLGVHPGPDITLAAAASVAGTDATATQQSLTELVRANLLSQTLSGRYAFHDLLRAYAAEQAETLDSAPVRRAAIRRSLGHYLHSAHDAALTIYPQRDRIALHPADPAITAESFEDIDQARAWFAAEHPVLLAQIRQGEQAGLGVLTWQLAWAIADVLDWRGQWHDLTATQEIAAEAARAAADPTGLAQAQRILARAHIRFGRWDDAEALLLDAAENFRRIGDLVGEANSQIALSRVHEQHGRMSAALACSQQALDLFQTAGHQTGRARSLNVVGWYHALLGEYEQAVARCTEALAVHAELGSRFGQAPVWDSLGYAHQHLGDHAEAVRCYENAIRLYREIGDRYHEADTLVHLGDNHFGAAEWSLAAGSWRDALRILDELNHPSAADVRPKLKQVEEMP
ncbi:tetratricopeptide (TPR) repeat protein/transcriptional regulator with XRE-family HTH domain [Hamadaea flava]|uniref:Tetratricopeptide repeat protein n=1 Tax=Hamadaea flava TaxID=1742688 RepID=A0ABV8M2B1_9ACTN|nr:tetratricopeptide repeat protein [Hamadaea flava]MCP2322102.1 tetratricopeptide (TPR) repeat protein/transcriptional regulator with XRE-family HTH domain [Hamadaea flava]